MMKSLCFSGGLELIKIIIYVSLNYWIQSYKLSKNVINEIERPAANFLWKGGIHAWSWANVCRTKKEVGFGNR